MRPRLRLFPLVPIFAAAFLLVGCDEAEQGRVLNYQKGTYLGQKDQALSDQDKEDLRQRTLMQQGT